ncbi:MAG: MFS transporter, partial [Planctomycetota bacterium]
MYAIFHTGFIDLWGVGIVLPLLPLYAKQFAQDLNWSSGQVGLVIGLLMASFSAMQFLVMPVWGRLSDRIGRRPVLLVGLAASTIFYGLFGVATTMHSLLLMFVARIGAGIAGATIGTAQAYIADCTSNQNRAKGMALIGAAFALGFTLGPSLGVVALLFGDRADLSPWPGFLAAILSGGAFLLAYFVLPESLTAEARGAS